MPWSGQIVNQQTRCGALMFSIEGVLIWLLLSRTRGAKKVGDTERTEKQKTRELEAAQARALPEPLPSRDRTHHLHAGAHLQRAKIRIKQLHLKPGRASHIF